MRCPECNADANVVDSRMNEDNSRRRRYSCPCCSKKFSTLERLVGISQTFVDNGKELKVALDKLAKVRAAIS